MRAIVHRISRIHFLAALFGLAFTLSLAHHLFNFWGLPWYWMAIVSAGIPLLALLAYKLLLRLWPVSQQIPLGRLFVFLIPAIALAAIISWRAFTAPITWHRLEIIPSPENETASIELIEIKVAQGKKVHFEDLTLPVGWILQDGSMVAGSSNVEPLEYSFRSPIDKPVLLTFATSPSNSSVLVLLDGRSADYDLVGPEGSLRVIEVDTRYRFNLDSRLIQVLVFLLDLLALASFFLLIFLIQETVQNELLPRLHKDLRLFSFQQLGIFSLLALGLTLHVINFLAVPLVVVGDSTSFLNGAVHWIQHYNLDGVSSSRGPGVSMLFIPAIWTFGRSAWGLKLLLHILALGCVPLAYLLGWQLTRKHWFAFFSGLFAVLTPDLYLYSNLVMSEIPNIFLGLAFFVIFIPALELFSWRWLIASMLIGSFNVLVRPENLLMLVAAFLFMIAKGIMEITRHEESSLYLKTSSIMLRLGVAILVGILPLLWWSEHNYRVHGFFGLSDYAGEVLYDGWVYFGESSRLAITDPNSASAQIISKVYSPQSGSVDARDVPTGWDVYPALLKAGYSSQKAFSILGQTAIDSILRDPALSLELLFIKLREGFVPETTATFTFELPGESSIPSELKLIYFDEESLRIPFFIRLQRIGYEVMRFWYDRLYQVWIWFCLAGLVLCFYRKPFFLWIPVAAITAIRIFFPTVMGISHWRYILSGILPLEIFALAGLQAIIMFITSLFSRQRSKPATRSAERV